MDRQNAKVAVANAETTQLVLEMPRVVRFPKDDRNRDPEHPLHVRFASEHRLSRRNQPEQFVVKRGGALVREGLGEGKFKRGALFGKDGEMWIGKKAQYNYGLCRSYTQ